MSTNPRTMKRERERLLKERAQEKDERRKARRQERADRIARGEDPDLIDLADGGPPAEADPAGASPEPAESEPA